MFTQNENAIDRTLRVVLGLGLLALAVAGPHTLWGLVGLVPLATGFAGFCPLYRLFGLSTCPMPRKPSTQCQETFACARE